MSSEPQHTPSTPATPPAALPPAPAPRRQGGGFFGRLIAALLVVVIATFLALLGTAAALLYLGYTVRTPAAASDAQRRAATLEALQSGLETRVIELDRRVGDQSETLGELSDEIEAMRRVRADLESQLQSGARQNATMVADARLSRDQVVTFATAEAGRAALLQELERRSARIERFLQRLSDIAEDTALDLGTPTPAAAPALQPAATATPSPTLAPEVQPTATLTPSPAPVDTPPPTTTAAATAAPVTPGGRASATAAPTASTP